ncbi:hypothetical protein SAMN05216276_101139 [Streptosporangium subroseum]|uniref:Uncharacterized protein n=1 Tax=Streptosporangium subroseum TaxID=106412 RepID=A0A239F8T1_9ACTN|nr:hypothetical protein [Streptosporangium subroseum]SNS53215.1 hypothetical protein SAMN05216276_101139 [Streptosporangium subroseum]
MEQLAFDSATFVTFKDRTDRWVDVKHFQVCARPEDDEQLLTTLISHEMYRDDYLGSDSWKDTESSVHGPYRLDALSATAFEGIDQATALATIRTWAEKYRELSETVAQDLENEVHQLIRTATSCYRLKELDEAARDDRLGWILGEFHELVLIDQHEGSLSLIVASDD